MNAQLPMNFLNAARVYDRPLIVDSFAGGGGASTGIEQALGRGPDIAINHDPAALALHEANHPDTLHLSENVYRIDPLDHLNGKHIGLMWFSPDCKHFSKAKGGKPVERNIRDLAWIIPGWIERIQKSGGKVDVVMMENVEEFAGWGPLIETDKGLMPCPDRKGDTFNAWCKKIRQLGGKIERRELRACDYGAPTIRRRLFVIIRFDGQPIAWPEPTHGDPASEAVKSGKLKPWRTAAECIDWSIPCPSIFDSKDAIKEKHGLRAKRPFAENTLARVARGLHRYVLQAERPFFVNLTHGGRVEDVAEPFKTITGANRGEKAVVVPTIVGCGGRAAQSRPRGGNEPFATVTAKADACLITPSLVSVAHGDSGGRREYPLTDPFGVVTAGGVSHAVIAPTLIRHFGQSVGQSVTAPVPTVVAGGGGKTGLIAPHLATMRNSQKPWQDADKPAHTVTAGGAGLTLCAPNLMSLKGTARRDSAATAPHPTVLAGGGHSAIVAPVLTYAQQGGANRSIEDPHHTICASKKDQNSLIAATMVHVGNGERDGQSPRALDISKPLNTVVAGGVKQYPVSAFFAKYYGTGDGARQDEPAHTVTTKDRFAHCEAQISCPPFTDAHAARARQVADLLRQFDLWDDREFVTVEIDGQTFVVVDVGMRMLTPRELFNAQGFPPDYLIEGVWRQDGDDWTFTEFPKTTQVRCVGNSVCPPVAEALARANCAHLVEVEAAT